MRSLAIAAESGIVAPTRIVCLPGAYHTPQDFVSSGFDTKVRERGLAIDLLFVDIEMRCLGDRRPLDQLKYDIVLPARALGYQSIWLAGISLGGFMALDYAALNPGDLDGLCLLAPYLGNRLLTREIADAPGLAAWAGSELAASDEERRIWRFIQARHSDPRSWYLGYGYEDRFAEAHRLMAEALPPEAVNVVPGGHDWVTWTTLWENFLDSRFT
ncbi:MAG TPA: alpha/beta fold hydrolase [Steroidobacteraceae bacterium]|nr:alpha/beta fold hydrolase [Steroidobacteraceae bacterium]